MMLEESEIAENLLGQTLTDGLPPCPAYERRGAGPGWAVRDVLFMIRLDPAIRPGIDRTCCASMGTVVPKEMLGSRLTMMVAPGREP
jgi:hypothetical protein